MAAINDLVLVHIDKQPAFFARIEDISPDVKPGWWHVKLLVLTVPLQVYTWILDDTQVAGAPFTMGGTPIVMEKVIAPADMEGEKGPLKHHDQQKGAEVEKRGGKVVSLAERKKDS